MRNSSVLKCWYVDLNTRKLRSALPLYCQIRRTILSYLQDIPPFYYGRHDWRQNETTFRRKGRALEMEFAALTERARHQFSHRFYGGQDPPEGDFSDFKKPLYHDFEDAKSALLSEKLLVEEQADSDSVFKLGMMGFCISVGGGLYILLARKTVVVDVLLPSDDGDIKKANALSTLANLQSASQSIRNTAQIINHALNNHIHLWFSSMLGFLMGIFFTVLTIGIRRS